MPNLISREGMPDFELDGIPNPENPQPDAAHAATEQTPTADPVETDPPEETTTPEEPEKQEPAKEEAGDEPDMQEELEAASKEKPESKESLLSSKKDEPKSEPAKDETKQEQKPDSQSANSERDKDLPVPENDPHIRPKFAKDFKAIKSKVIEARNQLDVERKQRTDLETRLKQLEEAAKKPAELPKDVQQKLAEYEQRIRELDITKSPEIQARFDAKITQQQDKILGVLKKYGFGKNDDDSDNPEAFNQLKTSGYSDEFLAPMIQKLKEGGKYGDAMAIERALAESIRLSDEKTSEIASWKTSYESKAQERQQAQEKQQQQFTAEVGKHQERLLNSELEEMSKIFPSVKRPADPLATDTPAIVAAKKQAQAEYDAMRSGVEEVVKTLNATGLPPDKAAEIHAKVGVNVIKSILYQNFLVPKLHAHSQQQEARIKELEGELGKVRKAGTISKAHSAAIQSPKGSDKPMSEDMGEAMADIAKSMGIPTN